MSANYLSLSESAGNHIPSRFDLNTGDTKASELLNVIITDYCPKSWYYFLEHILTSKTSDTQPCKPCYSFQTFNKFFQIFKDSISSQHHSTYITNNNKYYIQIWLLHAQSHIIEYQTKHKHSEPRSIKRAKLQHISLLYKELYKLHIGSLFSPFYIEWANYYVLRKKYKKAKQKIKIGIKSQAIPMETLHAFYVKLKEYQHNTNEMESFSFSDLSTSSDSDQCTNTDVESENDAFDSIADAPRRIILSDEDKTDANMPIDDEAELLMHYNHAFEQKKQDLHVISEMDILSPQNTNTKRKSLRTPFAVMNGTEKSSNANTNTRDVSLKFAHKRLVPFTPNTLLRNFKNNKSFSFSNRNSTRNSNEEQKFNQSQKENRPQEQKRPQTPFERDTKSKSKSPLNIIKAPFAAKNRRVSEPISPSWNNTLHRNTNKNNQVTFAKEAQNEPFKQNNHETQPCIKKRRTSKVAQERAPNNVYTSRDNKAYRNDNNMHNKYRNNAKQRQQMNITTVNGRKMMQLKCIGRGGSSKVYKVITKDTFDIFALKKITVSGSSIDIDDDDDDRSSDPMEIFMNEIDLLNKLKHKQHCIQMIDYEIIEHRNSGKEIRMLFECGEIDLAHLLKKQKNGCFVDVFSIAHYWKQMLVAVDTVHGFRIVHGDLKPANFLMVKGELKLIDFGIAKQIVSNETTRIARDSQIGTLNYICPEALISSNHNGNCYKLGRSADVWSLGCILHQMAFGFTPFTHLKFAVKLQTIVNPAMKINIKPHLSKSIDDIVKKCLIREPNKRITIQDLLEHRFLTTLL